MAIAPVEVRRRQGVTLVAGLPSQLGLVTAPRAPKTTAAMMTDNRDVLAAVDGPMFAKCDGEPSGYETYDCGVIEYRHLDEASGVDVASRHTARGMTVGVLGVLGGRAYAVRGGVAQPGSAVAVQLYPSMVFGGANEASTTRDLEPTIRAAVGILSDGRVFLAVSTPMGIRAMADVLIAMGATHAGYTDGGGSGSLYVRAHGSVPETRYNTTGRRVVTWVTIGDHTLTGSLLSRGKTVIESAIGASVPVSPEALLLGTALIVLGVVFLIVSTKE